MPKVFHLYIDDSGARHPDHKIGKRPSHGKDWFAMGGVLVDAESEERIKVCHEEFIKKWKIKAPLHSAEIRNKKENFSWIGKLSQEKQDSFYEELYQLMKVIPVTGIGCVIDRQGYDVRYREKHGRTMWSLCKTSFSVCVERSVKYAMKHDAKLKVFVEKSDKKVDAVIREYYQELKIKGMPFSNNMDGYNPVTSDDFKSILYDLKFKNKTSPIMQLADLYLWPICMGGYDTNNRPYKRLMSDKKIIDTELSGNILKLEGVKYSCF
ncbi:MAG: DUF3800 domain-containing protein [Alphaproteobacteria bacterium]|nr:DUF3800 domain-containing protein [Alphaproteobacteria bacterium]